MVSLPIDTEGQLQVAVIGHTCDVTSLKYRYSKITALIC